MTEMSKVRIFFTIRHRLQGQLRVKRDERRVSLIQGLDEGFVEAADRRRGAMEAPDSSFGSLSDDDAGGVGGATMTFTLVQQLSAIQEEPISFLNDHTHGM
jgi:hypothetical protein